VVDSLQIWQGAIGAGNGIGEDDIRFTAELVENLGEGEGGADGIAIRPRMGGE
jgi:hypothetical protein